ncbi:MAG: MATE family efflux transporter [Boseongicola sp.]|nr:MATE family efflux transporter [Boseongicola sp.]
MSLLTNRIAGLVARAYSRTMPDSVRAEDLPELRRQARALIRLGLPIVVSQLAQMAIVTTDTVMIGWYDVPSLAALSLSGGIWFIIFILGSGFAWAVMPIVASAIALNDMREVRRATRMAMWLSGLYGIAVTPLFLFFEPIFLAIGQDAQVAHLSGQYMIWLGLATAPALLVTTLRSYLSALERPNVFLAVILFTGLLNVVLNYALIFGNLGAPELGIAGAGIASLIGNLASFVLLAHFSARVRPDYALFRNIHRPDRMFLGRVFRLGLPIGLTNFAETGLFAAATLMMGWVGTVALAAHGVALQVASLTFMMHLGLSQAITVRAGRAWGMGDWALLKVSGQAAMILSLAASVTTIVLFLTLPEFLIGLFVDPLDPERPAILAVGASLLAVAALFQFVDSGQVMALGMLRGVQDTRVPMIIAVVSYWLVGLPVSYFFGFALRLEGVGIWLGLTVGLACACIAMQFRFWTRYVGSARMTG